MSSMLESDSITRFLFSLGTETTVDELSENVSTDISLDDSLFFLRVLSCDLYTLTYH